MKFLRVGICALIVFGVAAHGGVEDWALAVFEVAAGFLFMVWAVRSFFAEGEQLIISPLLLPLVAFAILVAGQYAFHLTASRYETRMDLLLLVADVIVFFLVAQAFRNIQEWRSFIWFVMVFGFVISAFGMLQHMAFNGKLYWFREMHYGGIPFGPYVNRNHFAGFAELVIPIALVPLVLGKVRRERWFVVGLFAVIPIAALLLSASRGGIVSLAAELAAIVLWVVLRRAVGKQTLGALAVLLVALLTVSSLGVREILQRFSSMQTLETTGAKRASMRRDTWRIYLAHPVIGTGLGTLQTVFPPYESLYDGKIVNHTHNDYLEALAETGTMGGLCCLWFLGVLFVESVGRFSQPDQPFLVALQFAALVGCCGFLVHSLVDFNLHIPANALLFFVMAYLATSEIQQLPVPSDVPRRRRRHRRKP
jgi:O-antigen ligase